MGSDAEVYLFDDLRYRSLVVPAIRTWLRDFVLPDQADWQLLAGHSLPDMGTDLAGHSTSLGGDLRYLGPPNRGGAWFDPWEARRCGNRSCESRNTCPCFSQSGDEASAANDLILGLMKKSGCLGESRFVGRSRNVGVYGDYLRSVGVVDADAIPRLLDALGSRGRLIGYQWANSDGVHGWLDREETKELAAALHELPLPIYESTLEAIDAHFATLDDAEPFVPWSLSVVRAMSDIAVSRQLGLLWGNDL